MRKFKRVKKFIVDLLFPKFCFSCKKEGDWLCQDCFSLIEISQLQFCPFCPGPVRVFEKGTCPKHRNKNLNGLYFATPYQNELVQMLLKNFKYPPFLKGLAEPLSLLIIAYFLSEKKEAIFKDSKNSFLMPVPLTKQRMRWRGFNQAAEIAKLLAVFFKVNVQFNNLIKLKTTQPQVELKREQREKNIRGAFQLKNAQAIRGKTIFLVDDVFTTGATMEEAARVLKKAGASEVWGIAVTREPLLFGDSPLKR